MNLKKVEEISREFSFDRFEAYEVWVVTGSQHLFGPKTLETVAEHSREMAALLGNSWHIPVNVVFNPVLTIPDAIRGCVWKPTDKGLCRISDLDARVLL